MAAKACDKLDPREQAPGTFFEQLLGNNIVLTRYHDWVRHRRIVSPALARNWDTKQFGEAVHNTMDRIVASNGEAINAHDLTSNITLDAFGAVLFDTKFNAIKDPGNRFSVLYRELMDHMFKPFYLMFPMLDSPHNPFRREAYEKKAELDSLFFGLVETKRKKLAELNEKGIKFDRNSADLLSLLVHAVDSETDDDKVSTLSMQELRNDILIMYLAGHDTSSTALAMAIYHLARDQQLQERARQSVIDVLGDNDPSVPIPTAEEQRQLTYLTMVVKEALRVGPPVLIAPTRTVMADFALPDGTVLPKDTLVVVNIYAIHNNPQYWDNPAEFNPDRFANDTADGFTMSSNPAWMPFGIGIRQCAGMQFAMLELRVILAMLLRKFTWTLAMPADEKIESPLATQLMPKNIRVSFKPRI
ncbi:cytochrome P450 [Ramicandelaber brevisporus]|nr:cytochrome P450 [Ramicandelaber brevisporus]